MSYSTDDDCYQEDFNRHGVSAQLKQLRPDGELHLDIEGGAAFPWFLMGST